MYVEHVHHQLSSCFFLCTMCPSAAICCLFKWTLCSSPAFMLFVRMNFMFISSFYAVCSDELYVHQQLLCCLFGWTLCSSAAFMLWLRYTLCSSGAFIAAIVITLLLSFANHYYCIVLHAIWRFRRHLHQLVHYRSRTSFPIHRSSASLTMVLVDTRLQSHGLGYNARQT